MALGPSRAAVGCPFGNSPDSYDNAGVAFLFDLSDGSSAGTLTSPTPSYSEQFGRSVALSNGTVVVGAPRDSSPSTFDSGGATHLYDAATHELLMTLLNPAPGFRDAFGYAVEARDNRIVVGAFHDDAGAPRSGSAFLFLGRVSNQPPDVASAAASEPELWPPNGRMGDGSILGVTDPEGEPVSVEITAITQDEPVGGDPDAEINADGTFRLRAAREGSGNGRVYRIAFRAVDASGAESQGAVTVEVRHDRRGSEPAVDDGQDYDATVPSLAKPAREHGLHAANSPNPFNPSTTIAFSIPTAARVSLVIYNAIGQEVRRLIDGPLSAGAHRIRWDGRDARGREAAGGVYVYSLVSERGESTSGRMLFLK